MASKREIEIVENGRAKGWTDSTIVAVVRQHRHNLKVAAQKKKIIEAQQVTEKEIKAEQDVITETVSLDTTKSEIYQNLDKYGAVSSVFQKQFEKEYRPIMNEETQELEWKYLDEDGNYQSNIKAFTLRELNKQNPNALNEYKKDNFKVVDGEWNIEAENGSLKVVEDISLIANLDLEHKNAKTNAAKRENGISAESLSSNLSSVKTIKEREVANKDYEDKKNTSYEDFLKDNYLDYKDVGPKPGMSDAEKYMAYAKKQGLKEKIALMVNEPKKIQAMQLAGFGGGEIQKSKEAYNQWIAESKTTADKYKKISQKVTDPDIYIQEHILNENGRPEITGYRISNTDLLRLEEEGFNLSEDDKVITEEAFIKMKDNRKKVLASNEVSDIEQYWNKEKKGEVPMSVLVGISNNIGVKNTEDFKSGAYVYDGTTYNVKDEDLEGWGKWNEYQVKHKKEVEYDTETKIKTDARIKELLKLSDWKEIELLDPNNEEFQEARKQADISYEKYKTHLQTFGPTVPSTDLDWERFYGKGKEGIKAAEDRINTALKEQSVADEFFTEDDLDGKISDMDDFNKFVEQQKKDGILSNLDIKTADSNFLGYDASEAEKEWDPTTGTWRYSGGRASIDAKGENIQKVMKGKSSEIQYTVDDLSAQVLSAYLSSKSQGFNKEADQLEAQGLFRVGNQLDNYSINIKELEDYLLPIQKEYDTLKVGMSSGEIESSSENNKKLTNLATKINVGNENISEMVVGYNKLVNNPKNQLMMDSYNKLKEESTDLKKNIDNLYSGTSDVSKIAKKQLDVYNEEKRRGEVATGKREGNWIGEGAWWNTVAVGSAIWESAVGGVGSMYGFATMEVPDFVAGLVTKEGTLTAKEKLQGWSSLNNSIDSLTYDGVDIGPLIDPETGDINWLALPSHTAGIVTDMAMMMTGGGLAGTTLKYGSKLVGVTARYGAKTIGVSKSLPKLQKNFTKVKDFLGKQATKADIANRGKQMAGSMMVIYPQNLQEAMGQISDDFTAEDAIRMAYQKTAVESVIEMINPDISMFPAMSKFKTSNKWGSMKLWKDGTNFTKTMEIFKRSLKQLRPELLEENLQEYAGGLINLKYNKKYGTDFHLPTVNDYKGLNILTVASVLTAGMIRTKGFRKGEPSSSMYQAALEDSKGFNKELQRQVDNKKITQKEADKIALKLESYVVAKNSIPVEEYNEMNQKQRQDTLDLLVKQEELQGQIKNLRGKDPKRKKELELDLNNTRSKIKRLANNIETEYASRKEQMADFNVSRLKAELEGRDSEGKLLLPLNSKERAKKEKEIAEKTKERNEFRDKAPAFEFNGKGYDNQYDFLSALNKAKENGYFDKPVRSRIRINKKVPASVAAFIANRASTISGNKIHKSGEVLMNSKQIEETNNFINKKENKGKTTKQFTQELQEEIKKEQKQDTNILNDLNNAILFSELKDRGYTHDLIAGGMVMQGSDALNMNKIAERELDRKIEQVKDITKQSEIQMVVMTREEILGAFPDAVRQGALNSHAFVAPGENSDGKIEPVLVINKDVAIRDRAFAAPSHELLHQIMFSIINGPVRQVVDKNGKEQNTRLTPQGKKLIEGFLDLLPKNQRDALDKSMEQRGYFSRDNNGDIIQPFELYAEEYLNNYHDLVVDGVEIDGVLVKFDNRPETRRILKRIADYFINFFKSNTNEDIHGVVDTNLETPEKLLEFIRTYNSQAIDGKFSKDIFNMSFNSKTYYSDILGQEQKELDKLGLKGKEGRVADVSFSKSQQNVQQEIDDLITPKESKELAAEVNDIYNDERLEDNQKELMIAAKYRGMAEARWKVAYRQSIGTSSQEILETFKEDIISEMLFDLGTETKKARTVIGLVRDFKTEKQKYGNTAAYINTFFKVRAFEVLSDFTKDKGFARSMDDAMNEVSQMEDIDNQIEETKGIQSGGIVVSERLIESEKGTDREARIKQHVSNINDIITNDPSIVEGKNYKTLPDLDPKGTISLMMFDPAAVYKDDGTPFWKSKKGKKLVGTSILDSIVKKLQNNDNLNQQDIKTIQPYLSKHNQLLWTSLPQGFMTDKNGKPTTATGVQNVLLEPFYNKSRRKGNLYPQYKKPSMPGNFLEVFGITSRGEVNLTGKETNVSQRVKALISQHGKIISNQTVRQNESTTNAVRNSLENGKSLIMFSKALVNNENLIPRYMQAINIMERTLPWGTITPDNIKNKTLKDKIRKALDEAGIPGKGLQSDIINELLGPTGIVISREMARINYASVGMYLPYSMEEQAMDYYELETKAEKEVVQSMGLKGTYADIVNTEAVITNARQSITDQVAHYMEVVGMDIKEEKSLEDSWNQATQEQREQVVSQLFKTKGQYASAGTITNGFWTLEFEGGPVIRNKKYKPGKTNRKQITEGFGDWAALINNAIEGVTIIPVKQFIEKGKPKLRDLSHITRETTKRKDESNKEGKGFKELYPGLNVTQIAESSNSVIENLDKKGRYKLFNQHKQQALDFREMITNQFIFFNNKYHNKNTLFGAEDMTAYLMTMGQGMTSPGRKAAYPWGISDGAKNVPIELRGKNLEYDHLKPNNVLVLKLAELVKQNLTEAQIRKELNNFFKDYVVNIIQKDMDGVVKMNKMQSIMGNQYVEGTDITNLNEGAFSRLFHPYNRFNIKMKAITALDPALEGLRIGEDFVNESYHNFPNKQEIEKRNSVKTAIVASRAINPAKGMSVWDFDDTLATTKSNVLFTTSEGIEGKLNAEEYASQYVDLSAQGYVFDFSEFNLVVDGKIGPFFKKFQDRIKKYGIEDNFILTARPSEAAPAIKEFLLSQGLDIPIENITGLANSTSEAKALWIADKVSDGYNDIYFADDALANVQAVKNILDQFDIKGKVQQAKIQFSKSIDPTFNNVLDGNIQSELDLNRILEQTKGVKAEAVFSDAQAKIKGATKGKWKFWVPYSAEDFKGLIYRFISKGRQGETQMAFFKKALFDPFTRAYEAMNASKQQLDNQYRTLLNQFKQVEKNLDKKINTFEGHDSDFTVQQAVRVYLWDKAGFEIPGLSKRDKKALLNFVDSQNDIKAFAENLSLISNQEAGYTEPSEYWTVENIQSDLNAINNEVSRSDHLAEWVQNKEIMFGTWGNDGKLVGDNINKIEAIYGTRFREALEDILWAMEFGTKREAGSNRLVNAFNNWANQSVGAIMFFNMRSALLQTISSINYLNWSDNNPLKAGAALLNFPQFLKDFTMIFNSDMLKQRRAGNQRGINEAELAAAVEGVGIANRAKAMLHYLLTKGFLPTQIADSFAISSGGATFYRNRVKTYLKQGMTLEQAETKAFQDFSENTEESQQSSRPDMISQQQRSPLGRYILAFKNTPMQYARLTKKAFLDLANGRGDAKTNVGKIIYYMGVQNLIFSALQAALGAIIGGDDEDKEKAKTRVANSMIDSIFGGLGFGGNVAVTLKNTILEYNKQEKKDWNADHTYTILKFFGLSPTISSKGRKLYSAIQTQKYNEDVINEMNFLNIDNPRWSIIANVVSATTNIPLDRIVKKVDNIDAAITEDITALQRFALLMGWNTWDLKVDDSDVVAVEDEIKERKSKKTKTKEKKKEKEKEKEVKEEKEDEFLEDQKVEKKEGKKVTCAAANKRNERCKNEPVDGVYCTIHVEVEQTTKEVQCKGIKSNKERCKMKTKAKSGLCYYHD